MIVGRCGVLALVTAALALAQPVSAQLAQDPLDHASERILVMPFENVTREGKIFWITEAASVLLADDLNRLGGNAITRDERRAAFERLRVPPAAVLSEATVIRIAQLLGATSVVAGSIRLEGDVVVVSARQLVIDSARVRRTVDERGPLSDLYDIFERIARPMLPADAQPVPGAEPQQPPLPVFETYVKGLLADSPETATAFLKAAISAQPGFDRARLALWDAYTEQGQHQAAADAVSAIAPQSSQRLRGRFLLGLSQLSLGRDDAAFETYRSLAVSHPTSAVFNNLGVVQIRRGGTPQAGLPTFYFTKAADLDTGDSDLFFNLGYAYWLAKDYSAAIYWLREAVRRDPADGEAHYVLGGALAASGSAAEAAREKELARRLSSTFAAWDRRPAADPIPKGLERLKDDVALPAGPKPDDAQTAQRDQQEVARFYVDRGRRLYDQEKDREALNELNRALFLSPYDAEANLWVGRIHLRGRRVLDAIESFKISIWSSETSVAHAALAGAYFEAKDLAAAESEAKRALALDPASGEAAQVLTRLNSEKR